MLNKIPFLNNFLNKVIQTPEGLVIRWRIILPVFALLLISLITLKHTGDTQTLLTSTYYKQYIWLGLGTLVFITMQWFRFQFFQEYAYHLYILLFLFIVITYFMPAIGGAKRWLILGPFTFQPSEIGKLFLVFALARYLAEQQNRKREIPVMIITLLMAIMPAYIVFKQPDFGTAIVYGFIAIPMLYWSGIRSFYLFSVIAPVISIIAAFNLLIFSIWMTVLLVIIYFSQPRIIHGVAHFIANISCGIMAPYIWNNILYHHQKERILTLLNPMRDPQGAGYQVIQSIIAIGSGGLWGKGPGQGTQTQLRYLPVRDTDFIISVIGEEMGLAGIFIILFCFFIMLYWIITYAASISNRFSSLVLVGFVSILFIHFTVNLGMTVGLLPVTGLPAPFLSYGGSFLLTCTIILAMVNSIINHHI
ncbi:MAG: rod shape-determining protein RodA [Candidatus Marinimicrobia bacterium]|jgi:rod shape determining protein RodA|nr:rod shape-determining protein RodA [Candidatus Neomarinimicrobiota bacterium]